MRARDRHWLPEPWLTRRGFLTAGAATLIAGCGPRGPDPAQLPPEILAFHRDCFVFDLHIDTLLWQRFLGYDPAVRHEPLFPAAAFAWHFDLPRALDAGLDGAVLAIVVAPREERSEQLWALKIQARLERSAGIDQTLESLDLLRATAERLPDRLRFVTTGSALRDAAAEGRFAALAGLEGGHGVEGSLDNLRAAWDRGLRMLGLVHFQASAAGYPMTAPDFADRGLTPFGFDLLAELSQLPMVVDLAHLNARGVEDCLAALRQPFVVSHSACRSLVDNPRNLDDSQLRRIADAGGVIGLAAGRSFLGPGGLDAFVAHAEHLANVAGEDACAIGSDWDGAIIPVPGMEDVRALPFLTAALLERRWPEPRIRKLLGQNALTTLTHLLG